MDRRHKFGLQDYMNVSRTLISLLTKNIYSSSFTRFLAGGAVGFDDK